jgi:hypothetical protein
MLHTKHWIQNGGYKIRAADRITSMYNLRFDQEGIIDENFTIH